jgi:predicted ferric reductase
VLVLLIAAGVVPLLYLWWHDTPAMTLGNLGGKVTAAGRITGLLATYLLLVEVALAARVPLLENRVGADRLLRVHRAIGEYLVCLVVAHAALIIVGYALTDHIGLPAETVQVVLDYPDVLMATAAGGLLLMVGVVSARAVRRKLRYESWHFTHLYVYLAVALAYAHQTAVGADLSADGRIRALWLGAHVAVGLAVLLFRVALPLRRSLRHRLRVTQVVRESEDVVSVYVAGRETWRLRAEPGQFFRWRFLTRGLWFEAHPFSLSAVPDGESLRVTIKALGDHSKLLQRLRPGIRVWVEGPYGSFTERRRRRSKVLLVAGGVGITPLRALFESMRGEPGDVIMLYRAASEPDLLFLDELRDLAYARGFPVRLLVGPHGPDHPDQLAPRALRRYVPDIATRDVFLCGPPGMVASARTSLRRAGVRRRHLHLERFDM